MSSADRRRGSGRGPDATGDPALEDCRRENPQPIARAIDLWWTRQLRNVTRNVHSTGSLQGAAALVFAGIVLLTLG